MRIKSNVRHVVMFIIIKLKLNAKIEALIVIFCFNYLRQTKNGKGDKRKAGSQTDTRVWIQVVLTQYSK